MNLLSAFLWGGLCLAVFLPCAVFAATGFEPRWSVIFSSQEAYYDVSEAEMGRVAETIGRYNAIYDKRSPNDFDIAFFPDIRAREFYEVTPYNDENGERIPEDDTVAKSIMELRYLLNENSSIGIARSEPINHVFNMLPKQETDVIFARVASTQYFKDVSFLCLIAFDPRYDETWDGRKAFLQEAVKFGADAGIFANVPEESWHNFIYHLRASMCANLAVATWLTEPPSLALDVDKASRKNKAFSFMFTFAALMSARDGHTMMPPVLQKMFEQIEAKGVPVFAMRTMVAELHPMEGRTRVEANIAYPFTPAVVMKEASKLDYRSYGTAQELADIIFGIVEKTEFDNEDLMTRWLTEEFESYRMGF